MRDGKVETGLREQGKKNEAKVEVASPTGVAAAWSRVNGQVSYKCSVKIRRREAMQAAAVRHAAISRASF